MEQQNGLTAFVYFWMLRYYLGFLCVHFGFPWLNFLGMFHRGIRYSSLFWSILSCLEVRACLVVCSCLVVCFCPVFWVQFGSLRLFSSLLLSS